ncbi:IS3 family transposase, partial [Allokutzneria sp. NRRL B-24872]|uniref:IS3 family transposase n=1 Tax=Allokutzneria sp. NRRL B-24872 TaxID=1137961 RepID=UPI001177AC1A
RIRQELRNANIHAGPHRIAKLMRDNNIRARRGPVKSRPRAAPPHRRPEIGDRVEREFTRTAPDQLWFADNTMIATQQGHLRATVVLDAFSRKVIGYSWANQETLDTALNALRGAITTRKPPPECVMHTDRGYHFTSNYWQNILRDNNMLPSIGRLKSPLDNAVMESWFASFKNEALYPYGRPATQAEAALILFRYIHFYNTRRLHSSLDYRTPVAFETARNNLSV